MDFGEVLQTAKQNGSSKPQIQYYSTKFAPPKKEQRNKTMSVNIQKFLARKEAEEKEKLEEARRRKENLLELRSQDKKATRRVNVMLRRTKSANQAAIEDAKDTENTAVTLIGASQPDEDDYGYVSKESEEFYNKMMEKYSRMPPEEPKFQSRKAKVSTNLSGTKEKVMAALERERAEANAPHRRKRKHPDNVSAKDEGSPVYEEEKKKDCQKPKFKAAPPVNFDDLLKLAAKKQHEPIVIEPKKVEEERLLTKKQKKEYEREREWKERKEMRGKSLPDKSVAPKPIQTQIKPTETPKIPKKSEIKVPITNANAAPRKPGSDRANLESKPSASSFKKPETPNVNNMSFNNSTTNSISSNNSVLKKNGFKPNENRINANGKIKEIPKKPLDVRPKVPDSKPKEFPPRDLKPKQIPPSSLKSKKIPHPDIRRKELSSKDTVRKPLTANKRRIIDDEEDYDSEMDDFIDDGPEEEEDYSSIIGQIFGYDKKKYKGCDEEEDMDNMESTFAQQMREECISTKIGIKEDLEDMQREEEEKKRKALRLKKLREK